MYSDDWRKEGYATEEQITVFGPVYFRRTFNHDGNIIGVTIDYELADDFHYELIQNEWCKFCDRYLSEGDVIDAFKAFISDHGIDTIDGVFAFENALKESDIKYQKIAFY